MLANPRHEAFCRALVEGESANGAYAKAGYKRSRKNAARLRTNDDIQRRVTELQANAARKTQVTIETIAAQLDEDRALALRLGQASAAVQASVAKAKLFGLVVDRRELETHVTKPMRTPGPHPSQMTIAEWQERFVPKTEEPNRPAPANET